jgi:predicted RNase H-like HicB family nuclease
LRFLTDGETIFVLTNKDREIIDTLKKGQDVFAIAIGELINDLKSKTSKVTMDRVYMVQVSKRGLKVMLHPDLEDGGYWVECPELPGCFSQGDSVEEALDMIKDAIQGHLDVQEELKKETSQKMSSEHLKGQAGLIRDNRSTRSSKNFIDVFARIGKLLVLIQATI